MVDKATIAAELAFLQGSVKPVYQVIADLYRSGEIYPDGIRNGRIAWKAHKEAH